MHLLLEQTRTLEHAIKKHLNDSTLEFKTGMLKYVLHSNLLFLLTVPVIYSVLIPALALDLAATVYMHICFPIYGIARVRRHDYMIFDRHKMEFLNGIEKVNCEYCSYFNGLIGYLREIAARTEQYWCPLRHSRTPEGAHQRYPKFAPYGHAGLYRRRLEELRRELAELETLETH